MRAPNPSKIACKRGNGHAQRIGARLSKLAAFALLPAALLFSLSGCAPSHQPEHRAYVISMGVDTNDNSDCVVSIQIPSITGSSGSPPRRSSSATSAPRNPIQKCEKPAADAAQNVCTWPGQIKKPSPACTGRPLNCACPAVRKCSK